MKKIVGTIAAIALAASSAFAGVNVGMGFNRGFFTPFAYDGKDARMDISTSWGAQPRVGASFSAASDDCGVVADIKFDGGAVNVNDNAYIWCKPTSWLKFTIGQTFDDTLRGNACFGSWDWLRFGGTKFKVAEAEKHGTWSVDPTKGLIYTKDPANPDKDEKFAEGPSCLTGEDFIFTRICGNPLSGAYAPVVGTIVMIDPIEGLHVAAAFNIDGYNNQKAEDVISKLQVQAGYTIANVGTIKAQWIGAGDKFITADEKANQIEAAFDLTAVENMSLSVGAKFRTYKDAPVDVAAYWTMGFDALRLHASVGATFSKVDDETATGLVAGVGADYDLGNGLGVSADFRFANVFMKDVDSDPSIGFGAYLNKGIANGGLGIGVEGAVRGQIRDFAPSKADDFTVAVPVRVQCFF